jgi:hypothetical protein
VVGAGLSSGRGQARRSAAEARRLTGAAAANMCGCCTATYALTNVLVVPSSWQKTPQAGLMTVAGDTGGWPRGHADHWPSSQKVPVSRAVAAGCHRDRH